MDSQVVQDLLPGTGSLGSVPMQHNYKRTVIRTPPKHFTVEMLPCRKFGNGFCYGMRINPVGQGAPVVHSDTTSTKSGSTSSSSSGSGSGTTSTVYAPYEIWRRWEDCLWFQDLLENEYKLMARTKRTRLQQGKGVKKDGVYIHSDQAASFESLPPGPDANTIAKDVHEILPKLTKRGTIFKAGRETIEQRDREFRALVERLWSDDLPILLRELREDRIIRDFFGYWRRDKDHDRKLVELRSVDKGKNRASRMSITSSAFSMYFSSTNSLQLPNAFSDYPPSPSAAPGSGPSSLGGKPKGQSGRSASFSTASGSSKTASSSRGVPQSAPATGGAISFTVSENGALVPTSSPTETEDPLDSLIIVPPSSDTRHPPLNKIGGSLPVLSEEHEQEDIIDTPPSTAALSFPQTSPTTPPLRSAPPVTGAARAADLQDGSNFPPGAIRRPRNMSCPDPGNRNGLVFSGMPPSHQPRTIVADIAPFVPARPMSMVSTTATGSQHWEDTSEKLLSEISDEDELFSRRTSWRTSTSSTTSGSAGSASPRSPAPRPFSMFSTASSSHSYFDDADIERYIEEYGLGIDLDIGVNFEDMPSSEDGRKGSKGHYSRGSIATMNSIMSGSSVDAVLPHTRSPPSSLRSESPDSHTMRDVETPIPGSAPNEVDEEALTPEVTDDDELVDAYFYDTERRSSIPQDHSQPPPSPRESGYSTPRRERVSHFITQQMSTPQHFPKPFQNRPPGQFHLPWTPTESTPSTPPLPSSPLSAASVTSFTSTSTMSGEHFTIKAIREDSIVLLRIARSMSLALVRERMRDKFSSQEGVALTSTFTIGFDPAPPGERQSFMHVGPGRPRAQSASAGQPRLRFITNDVQWEEALSGSGGKLTVHIFDRF